MSYVLDYRESPNQTYDSSRLAPDGIVIHHWGSDGQSHDGIVSWLTNRAAGTSAHYVVSAGRVTCLVDPIDTAWHAGAWPANYANVGIECRPEMSDEDFETVAECIAYLRQRFGNLPLVGHKDIVQTACPGRWYARLAELSARADEIQSGNTTPKPNTESEEQDMFTIIKSPNRPHAIVAPGVYLQLSRSEQLSVSLNVLPCRIKDTLNDREYDVVREVVVGSALDATRTAKVLAEIQAALDESKEEIA